MMVLLWISDQAGGGLSAGCDEVELEKRSKLAMRRWKVKPHGQGGVISDQLVCRAKFQAVHEFLSMDSFC